MTATELDLIDLEAQLEVARADVERLKASMAARQAEAKIVSVLRVRAMMTELGVTVADVVGTGRAKLASVKPARVKGTPMYRDPVTGATALGKGKHPVWLRAALKAGATLDSLKIMPITADDKIAA